jgi:hypothetical protein
MGVVEGNIDLLSVCVFLQTQEPIDVQDYGIGTELKLS